MAVAGDPAVPAIMGMLQLNQMGADWAVIAPKWLQLWGLLLLFFPLAVWGVSWRRRQLAAAAN